MQENNTDCREPIGLWDGKYYCANTLEHIAPELVRYKTLHDVLYSIPYSTTMEFHETLANPKRMRIAAFFVAMIITLAAATEPECQHFLLLVIVWLFVFTLGILMAYVNGTFFNLQNAFFGPLVLIMDGTCSIECYERIVFPFYSKVVLKVPCRLKIIKNDRKSSSWKKRITSTFLLDITDTYEQARKMISSRFIVTQQDEIGNKYYMRCVVDPSLVHIWESFIGLSQQHTGDECSCSSEDAN